MRLRSSSSLAVVAICLAAVPFAATAATAPDPVEVAEADGTFAEPRPLAYVPEFEPSGPVPLLGREMSPAPFRIPPDNDDPDAEPAPILRGVIERDLRTGATRRFEPTDAVDPSTRLTRGGLPDPSVLREAAELLKRDYTSWFPVNPLSAGRSMNVRLAIQWMDEFGEAGMNEGGGCSGILIGPRHVLTAGHCVYSFEDDEGDEIDDFAISLQVFPATDGPVDPFGAANAVKLRVWTGWSDWEDLDYDIALIELDRPVGAIAGWSAFGTSSDCDFFESGLWVRDGYPGTPFDGFTMLEQVGDFDDCDTNAFGWYGNNLQYDEESFGGSSGSGARKNDVVWAIHSHRDNFANSSNDVRVWPEAFDDIEGWIATDTPNAFDFHALNTRSTTDAQVSGFPIEDLDFLVHNSSEQSGSSFVSYVVYISDDQIIDTNDTYVTSGSLTHAFQHNSSLRVNVPDAFVPAQLSTGQYWIGVLLTESDQNNSNNRTGPFDVFPIQVVCQQSGVPQPAFPEDGHPCVPTTLTLNWGSVPGTGVQYEVSLRKKYSSSTPDSRLITTSSTQITVDNLHNGESYVWSVRASTVCGDFGPKSQNFEFLTVPTDLQVYQQAPADAAKCVPTTVTLRWVGEAGSEVYRVRISENGGPADTYYSSDDELTLTTLQPDSRYNWSVAAADGCGNFYPASELWGFRTVVSTAPDAPTPLHPLDGSLVAATIPLSVRTERFASSYEWELETSGGVPVDSDVEPGPHDWIVGPLPGGSYRWRARYTQCSAPGPEVGPWSPWVTFDVDGEAPSFAAPPQSQNHTAGVWTNSADALITWSPATDNGTIAGYSWVFDQDPTVIPDDVIESTTPSATATLSAGGDHWFHVVAVDVAGNVSDVQSVGPLQVDTTAPPIPQLSQGVSPSGYTNEAEYTLGWDPVVDAVSGVSGYSVLWSTNPSEVLDESIDTTEPFSTHVSTQSGSIFFWVRAIDAAGNAGPIRFYSVYVDIGIPQLAIAYPADGAAVTYRSVVDVDFTAVDDVFPPNTMNYVHEYSLDGGVTWSTALLCEDDPSSPNNPPGCPGGLPLETAPGSPGWAHWIIPWATPGHQAVYRITATDRAGNAGQTMSTGTFVIDSVTGAGNTPAVSDFALLGASPNPFNPRTVIRFAIPRTAEIRLDVYDMQGRHIRSLFRGEKPGPAHHEVVWDGTTDRGDVVSSGVYFYRLESEEFRASGRMALMK